MRKLFISGLVVLAAFVIVFVWSDYTAVWALFGGIGAIMWCVMVAIPWVNGD